MSRHFASLVNHRILIVEDDLLLVNSLETALSQEGFSVTTTDNGELVYDLAKEHVFDLIFMDVILPGNSGFSILKQLKNDPATKAIPVVMLTNVSDIETIERSITLGAADFMIKANVTLEEIVKITKKHLLHLNARYHEHRG